MIRAILRECTYLPDPVARTYMREYVLRICRQKATSFNTTEEAKTQAARKARKCLSFLQRANEGYPKPLEKVLFQAYGRIGNRRHHYTTRMLHHVPADTNALRELVKNTSSFGEGWQPPTIVLSLIKSQLSNGLIQSRVKQTLKTLEPVIPKENSWSKPVSEARQRNIRRKWYSKVTSSILPPLPDEDLTTLEGLISGELPWAPVQRRKAKEVPVEDNPLLLMLTDGPQKGHTFRDYADGRPHEITARHMRRYWKRISCLVPRMHWNSASSKWDFTWDTPKKEEQFILDVDGSLDMNGSRPWETTTKADPNTHLSGIKELVTKPNAWTREIISRAHSYVQRH